MYFVQAKISLREPLIQDKIRTVVKKCQKISKINKQILLTSFAGYERVLDVTV